MVKSSALLAMHFVAVLKRRLRMKSKPFVTSSGQNQYEVLREIEQTSIIGWPDEAEFDSANHFALMENAFLEDVDIDTEDLCSIEPEIVSSSTTNLSVSRTTRRRVYPLSARFSITQTRSTQWRSPNNTFTRGSGHRPSRTKRNRVYSRVRLLLTLLPLLQETLSLFEDLLKIIENCATGVKTFVESMVAYFSSPVAFILALVAIVYLEVLVGCFLWAGILTLWLRPPQIFSPPCKLCKLPVISEKMCRIFQSVIQGGAVVLSLVTFHGGIASMVTWAMFISVYCLSQFLGFLLTFKLGCIIGLTMYALLFNSVEEFRLRVGQALQNVPGMDFYKIKN